MNIKSALIIISFFISFPIINAQPEVDASRLIYGKIQDFHASVTSDVDSVFLDDIAGFSIGDTVLFYMSIGINPGLIGSAGEGNINDIFNTGKYAILLIDDINISQNIVIFNTTLPPPMLPRQTGETGQLIKIPTYETARLTGDFDFPAWNPVEHKGGIFPLIVSRKLILESDLNANGKGFSGAVPYADYAGDCINSIPGAYHQKSYLENDSDSAGLKGEGLVRDGYPYTRGYGRLANAGGGGNGKFSGGGGGSNEGGGGRGGNESSSCIVPGILGGIGGQSLSSYYTNNSFEFAYNRIYMGGGGGSGTQTAARQSASGGNGGGIIILIVDTLEANGQTISANGDSVSAIVNGAGAGGGGGGVIVLDVSNYSGNLNLSAKGGRGGSVTGIPDTTGTGGGGGGGIIWHNKSGLPPNISSIDFTGGASGTVGGSLEDIAYSAAPGAEGTRLGNLTIPIRGFLINAMPGEQTVCEGVIPRTINASPPKGGTGTYTYKWIKSLDEVNWIDADLPNDQETYQPPALSDTTYFRRITTDGFLVDTSFSVRINVHPILQSNLISSDDTVCYNSSPGILTASVGMTGGLGSGTYNYSWINSGDQISYQAAPGSNGEFSYLVPDLIDTTYYKRIVESGQCVDTSNMITIKVLNDISGNIIEDDQIICNNQVPSILTGPVPDGGLNIPAEKRYQWQVQFNDSWADQGTGQNYNPPALPENTYEYRRIVYSGNQNECVDTSNIVTIVSLPDIQSNEIINGDSTICAGLPSINVNAKDAGGGDGSYAYIWQKRTSGSSEIISESQKLTNETYQPGSLNNDTWIRRIVYSGANDVCKSTSDSILISVLTPIEGNTISSDQVICQNTSAELITGSSPGEGGGEPYIKQWQFTTESSGIWNNTGQDDLNYDPGIMTDVNNYNYRRIVFSGPENTCSDTSNQVSITVQPEIINNVIVDFDPDVCLNAAPGPLDGSTNSSGGDGNPSFAWEQSNDDVNWNPASEISVNEDYQPGTMIDPLYFRRIVNSGVCSDTTSSAFIDTLSLPRLTELSGSEDQICDDLDFYLKFDIDDGVGPYQVEYLNGTADPVLSASFANDEDSVLVDIEGRGIEIFNITIDFLQDANGCYAPESNLLNYSVNLEIYRSPQPEIIKPSDPYEECGSVLQLTANPDEEVESGWWEINNSGFTIDDSNAETINLSYQDQDFNAASAIVYYYQETPSCGRRKDSLAVNIYEQPEEPTINDGEELTLFVVDNFSIEASNPTAGTFSWSLETGNATLADPSQNPVQVQEIPVEEPVLLKYTVMNGVCELLSDEISIIRKEVHIYEGISPEVQDNLNDVLVAEGLDDSDVRFVFQIFSGTGQMIREITDEDLDELGFQRGLPNNGLELWDGKNRNGNNFVPAGTYYYVIKIEYRGREFISKGYVVVK